MWFETMWSYETENQKPNAKTQKEVNVFDYENNLKAQKQAIIEQEDMDDEEADRILLALEDTRKTPQIDKIETEAKYCIKEWITKEMKYPYYDNTWKMKAYVDVHICWNANKIELSNFGDYFWYIERKSINPEMWELTCSNFYEEKNHTVLCSPLFNKCFEEAVELCLQAS